MTKSKKRVIVGLVLLVMALGSLGYLQYQDYVSMQVLEESVEYQVLTAIETVRPEVYVVAVQEIEDNVFVYLTVPAEVADQEYFESMLGDVIGILYNAYPEAKTYHVLPTEIVDINTFEGAGHFGQAITGYGFTNYAAQTMTDNDLDPAVMFEMFQAGEFGVYQPKAIGLHLVQKASPRPSGHIPPWAEVEG